MQYQLISPEAQAISSQLAVIASADLRHEPVKPFSLVMLSSSPNKLLEMAGILWHPSSGRQWGAPHHTPTMQ